MPAPCTWTIRSVWSLVVELINARPADTCLPQMMNSFGAVCTMLLTLAVPLKVNRGVKSVVVGPLTMKKQLVWLKSPIRMVKFLDGTKSAPRHVPKGSVPIWVKELMLRGPRTALAPGSVNRPATKSSPSWTERLSIVLLNATGDGVHVGLG